MTDTTPIDTTPDNIEPTEEEIKNGWTAKSLTDYLKEREKGQFAAVDPDSSQRRLQNRPTVQNHHYHPHRWRS